jgi:EAL domain-containing protein (putative c-di-GMP-specific phosphodiesterase class I)
MLIAEGIETDEQLAFLREQGCQRGQGFLFSRPLPSTDLVRLLGAGAPEPDAQPDAGRRSLI